MGCGGVEVRDFGLRVQDLSNIQNMNLDLKNSLIYYISPKIPKYIKIGIYVDTIYQKKRGLEKIIKYKKAKFFLHNDSKKSFNSEILVNKFLENFPQFSKNDDISKNPNNIFSPNSILNDNYSSLFKLLNIETNNKNNFAICFINEKEIDSNLLNKLKIIKEKFDENFYIYKIENKEDKYSKMSIIHYFSEKIKLIFG